MKLKNVIIICSLLLITLFGCGKAPEVENFEEVQMTKEEIKSQEPVSISIDNNESKEESSIDPVLEAYKEILKAAPGFVDENDDLYDLTLDFEENIAKFGNHLDWFAITDINEDGVKELIASTTVNFRWSQVFVYTYADGNAVLLKDPLNIETEGTFMQSSVANGGYITYICEDKHIHSVWSGTDPMNNPIEKNYAYVLEGTTLTLTDCNVGESENATYFPDIAEFNSLENLEDIK